MKKHLGVLIVETVQLQPTPVVSGNGKRHKIVSVMVKKSQTTEGNIVQICTTYLWNKPQLSLLLENITSLQQKT